LNAHSAELGSNKREAPAQKRKVRFDVDGWICLDKPVGVTSTQAVGRLRFLLQAKKAGHAGTLDPLASGVLPVAFGEATKTIPIVQEGVKAYEFAVKWGEERETDDGEGQVVARSDLRPSEDAVRRALPRFTGLIEQRPPVYSAIKVKGERAYDLARDGAPVELAARTIAIHRLELARLEGDVAILSAECGKGAYVRSLARDLGRALGCFGYVAELRRTRVGPFEATSATSLDDIVDRATALAALLPIEAGLSELPRIVVDRDAAAALRRGHRLLLRGGDAPVDGPAYVSCFGAPVAIGAVEQGYFVSSRVLNAAS